MVMNTTVCNNRSILLRQSRRRNPPEKPKNQPLNMQKTRSLAQQRLNPKKHATDIEQKDTYEINTTATISGKIGSYIYHLNSKKLIEHTLFIDKGYKRPMVTKNWG